MFLGLPDPDPSIFDLYIIKQSQAKNLKKLLFFGIFNATDEKSRIRIRESVVIIRRSGSVPKCHGSTILVADPDPHGAAFNRITVSGSTCDSIFNFVTKNYRFLMLDPYPPTDQQHTFFLTPLFRICSDLFVKSESSCQVTEQ